MGVQIVSRETIQPATKDGSHDNPKTFSVSLLDNLSPHVYTPITFFYSMNETNGSRLAKEDVTKRLKCSLSETLARFYMLAGRIKGNSIHCSDDGALFVEARVKTTMAEFLKQPKLELLSQFLPLPLVLSERLDTAVQIAAQLNFFACGGIAIGLSFLHKIIDGTTMSAFIKSWAASNRGTLEKLTCANYSSVSSLFPQREISPRYTLLSSETPFAVSHGRSSTTRRFVFDAIAISNLKTKAKSISVPNPTSVEVLTCFIWKHAMKASRYRLDKEELPVMTDEGQDFVGPKWRSVLVHIVNMRRRMQPPLSEHDAGNIFCRSCTYYEASNTETEMKLDDLEGALRQSLSKINSDLIQKTIGEDGFETIQSQLQQLHELYEKGHESYMFTSWRNMGLKDVSFGWGKPIWIGSGGSVFDSQVRNLIILMETTASEDIEAWVVLDDETMNLLEHDCEFLEFASLNPSIPLP